MEIQLTTSVSGDLGITEMIQKLEQLDGTKVEAGLFGGMNQNKAIWNEYGTSRGIPARPFLRTALYENEGRFADRRYLKRRVRRKCGS
ncbi:hypothetical protein [Ligilactobacillus equi]